MTITNIHELDVLRWESMTDVVRKFPSTGPHYFRENVFTNRRPLVGTDIAVWEELTRSRRRVPYQVRGQPAQRMEPLTRGVRSASVAEIFVSKQLRADQIEFLRQYGTTNTPGSQQIINDELEDLNSMLDNTIEYACCQVALGALSIDQTASVYAKSKGVKFSISFPVATQALGLWTNSATKIYSTEFSLLFEKAISLYGQQPARIIHTSQTMDLLLQNVEVKEFLGDQYKTQLLSSGRLSNIRGVQFISYDTGDDESGSWAKYMPANKILVLPGDNRYFELFEADALIPAPGLQSLIRTTPGRYSYSVVNTNPPGIEMFVGYRFLPVNRFAERVIVGTYT